MGLEKNNIMSSEVIPLKTLKEEQQFFNHLRALNGNKHKNTHSKSTIPHGHQNQRPFHKGRKSEQVARTQHLELIVLGIK